MNSFVFGPSNLIAGVLGPFGFVCSGTSTRWIQGVKPSNPLRRCHESTKKPKSFTTVQGISTGTWPAFKEAFRTTTACRNKCVYIYVCKLMLLIEEILPKLRFLNSCQWLRGRKFPPAWLAYNCFMRDYHNALSSLKRIPKPRGVTLKLGLLRLSVLGALIVLQAGLPQNSCLSPMTPCGTTC